MELLCKGSTINGTFFRNPSPNWYPERVELEVWDICTGDKTKIVLKSKSGDFKAWDWITG